MRVTVDNIVNELCRSGLKDLAPTITVRAQQGRLPYTNDTRVFVLPTIKPDRPDHLFL